MPLKERLTLIEAGEESSVETSLKSKISFSDDDVKERYDKAQTDADKTEIVNTFIDNFLSDHHIDPSKISKFRTDLVNQIKRFGSDSLSEHKNPFLKYISVYNEVGDLSLINSFESNNKSDWANLEAAYAAGAITDRTLSGNGQNSYNNIIFNKSMLGRSKEDFIYLTKAFSWLNRNRSSITDITDKCDADQLSLFAKTLGDEKLRKAVSDASEMSDEEYPRDEKGRFLSRNKNLAALKLKIKNNFVKICLFVNGFEESTIQNNQEIREAKSVYNALDYLDDQTGSTQDKSEIEDIVARKIEGEDAFKRIGLDTLSDERARDAIAYILKNHKGINLL